MTEEDDTEGAEQEEEGVTAGAKAKAKTKVRGNNSSTKRVTGKPDTQEKNLLADAVAAVKNEANVCSGDVRNKHVERNDRKFGHKFQ